MKLDPSHVSDNPVALAKKRDRPLKEGDKDLQDDEIHVLIELWAKVNHKIWTKTLVLKQLIK